MMWFKRKPKAYRVLGICRQCTDAVWAEFPFGTVMEGQTLKCPKCGCDSRATVYCGNLVLEPVDDRLKNRA